MNVDKQMKLYIWKNVLGEYNPGSGFMVALAENLYEARKLIKENYNYVYDDELNEIPIIQDLTKSIAFVSYGN
jgi:hypothetical protein